MEGVALSSVEHPVCEWVTDSRKFGLFVRPNVIGRLTIESWMAFKRVPRRGLEVGGLLFGDLKTAEDVTSICIEGFQAVESEHRMGPSFLLSETDLTRLQTAIRKGGNTKEDGKRLAPLGMFRSHTRSERLELSQSDIEVFDGCLGTGGMVFLLLGPAIGKGAVYVRVDGTLRQVHEFPIASSLSTIMSLRPEAPHAKAEAPPTPAPEAGDAPPSETLASSLESLDPSQTIRVPVPPPAAPLQIQHSISIARYRLQPRMPHLEAGPETASGHRGGWLVPAMIGCLVLGAAANSLSDSLHRVIAADRRPAQFLDLKVQPAAAGLRLIWDPNSYLLGGSPRAILHVQDGNRKSDRDLTPAEFSSGALSYQPQNRDVTFQLDVYSLEPNASGSVAVVNYGSSAAPAQEAADSPIRAAPPRAIVPAAPSSDASILEWSEAPTPAHRSHQARENPGLGAR